MTKEEFLKKNPDATEIRRWNKNKRNEPCSVEVVDGELDCRGREE